MDPVQVVKNRLKYGTNTFETSNSMPTYTEGAKVIKSFFFGLNTLIWLCAVLSLSTSAVIGFFYQGHSYGAEVRKRTNQDNYTGKIIYVVVIK